MAVVWGEAEVVLHTDGRALPGEVRAATTQAAQVGARTFGTQFRKGLSRQTRAALRDFVRSLGNLIQTTALANGVMRRFYETTIYVRRGFNTLSTTVRNFANGALRRVTTGFRNFGEAVRVDAVRTMDMLAEGASHLRINLQDVQDTFPGITRAVRAVGRGFEYVTDEVRTFGNLVRTDSIRTMEVLREGASHLKISLDDVRDTFPGLTRVVRGSRTALARTGEFIRTLGLDMEEVRPAVERVSTSFSGLINTFQRFRSSTSWLGKRDLSVALENLRIDLEGVAPAADEASDAVGARSERASQRGVGGVRKLLASWKSLPHGFRQAVFWTGLVISAMGSLAVAGSALSGTIVTLITQIGALAAGVGFAVAGFAGLYAEGAKLTEGAQASKDAFAALGDAFATIRESIANNMFGGMADSINNITNVLLPALQGNIDSFAQTTGQSLARIFDALSSESGVANFQALLAGFSPILESLTTAAITFGDAIADILIASLPTAQAFAEAIGDVGTQFSTWTSSEEGRTRLAEFFATAERIMPALVDLVVAFADALSGLVTPTTIAGFEQFIQSITDFMPVLGEMVGIIANLNIFGILAAALELIGGLLGPLIPPLAEFARILGEVLVEGLTDLIPEFQKLGESLVPVIEFVGELVVAALPPLIEIIGTVIENVAAWIEMIAALLEALLGGEDGVENFGKIVGKVFEVIGGVITFTTDIITGALRAVVALLEGDTAGAFEFLRDGVASAMEGIGIDFAEFNGWVVNMWTQVQTFFGKIGTEISNFGRDVANVFEGVIDWIRDAIGWFQSLFGAASSAAGATNSARSSASGGANRPMASGGILYGPTRILAGEAGREAIVPLERSLNRVDPSVRWLSAIAQGKTPAMASGGIVGGGRSITIGENAIVVNESGDPRRTANEVLQRLAENVVG